MSNKFTEQQIQDSVKAFELAMRQGSEAGIQHSFNMGATWEDEPEGGNAFDFAEALHRIKPAPPTPKLRAWRPEEVPVGALVRTKGKPDMGRWLIINLTSAGITTAGNQQSSSALQTRSEQWYLETCEHSINGGKTWLPCGVLE